MLNKFMKKFLGSKNERDVKKMGPLVSRIGDFEAQIQALSDADLQGQTPRFRERIAKGESLDALLPEAFATVRETAKRQLGMRHYDVQLVGGITLHRGQIAEMKTGEGKTLVATLATYLNALPGKGVHVVTVNDYLAQRDCEWMGGVYRWLGLSTGVVLSKTADSDHAEAYQADVTYGQNNEFGFDFLRDNMKFSKDRRVQRPLNYAIVDEVDSILVDEARTPLIISGRAEASSDLYYTVNDLIRPLKRDQDFLVDEKSHTVTLTEVGVDKIERKLKIDNLYAPDNTELLHHIHQALKAHSLYKREVNYLVDESKVVIVDEFTGRKMPGRRWSDGLHQAVEAKEGLKIQDENQTLATVTFQNYFRMYDKLSGMTGTADTEAEEFASIYDLDVLVIPTNKPILRSDREDVVFTKEKGKVNAMIEDIVDCNKRGQPVLVGTTSVDKSEFISKMLNKHGVTHDVLNAKYHEMEASIVAQAGRKGAVVLATNMAGRGTDIVLGGNPEFLARNDVGPEATDEEFQEALVRHRKLCAAEREEVLAAGGLHIVGLERHESRRIDNQLRGRAGRQGDPGSSCFYLSLEDDLLRIFNAERIQAMMEKFNVPDDEPIVHRWVTKAIENAQQKVEARNFDIRKNLLEYDDVMSKQRETVYAMREEILDGANTHGLLFAAVDDVVDEVVGIYMTESDDPESEGQNLDGLAEAVKNQFHVDVDVSGAPTDHASLVEFVSEEMKQEYKRREQLILSNIIKTTKFQLEERYSLAKAKAVSERAEPPPEPILDEDKLKKLKLLEWQDYERTRYLQTIDSLWKDHLQSMKYLREGVHLHAYAQKDPKLIYKQEAFELFAEMVGHVRRKAVETAYLTEVTSEEQLEHEIRSRRASLESRLEAAKEASMANQAAATQQAAAAAGARGKVETYTRERPKVGRNDPCYCGSGKKYKKCHLPNDEAEIAASA